MTQQSHSQAYTPRKQKLKKRDMYPIVHCSTIYNSQNMEALICPLTDEWIKKLWYIYTMEYYSAIKRNAFESVLMMLMTLEPIIHSKVSQKEKDKYHILTHIYGIQKNGSEEFIYREAMEKQTQRIELWTWGGEERVRCMERVTWKLTLSYVKQIANENLRCGSGNSNRGSVSI